MSCCLFFLALPKGCGVGGTAQGSELRVGVEGARSWDIWACISLLPCSLSYPSPGVVSMCWGILLAHGAVPGAGELVLLGAAQVGWAFALWP